MSATSISIILSQGDGLTTSKTLPQLHKRFPNIYKSVKDRIGVTEVNMNYSWFNLTQAFNNLATSYVWTDGVTYPVIFPPGFYQFTDLNSYVQQVMFQNGHYLVDENGLFIFYLSFQANPVYYTVTLTSTPIPTTLPSGWTNPSHVVLNGKAPQLIVSSSNNWGVLLGFTSGFYPASLSTVPTSFNSSLTPTISPITTVNVLCDFVNDSRFSTRPSCIASFSPDVTFGSFLSYRPTILSMYDVVPKNYDGISISFVDQLFRPLTILDYDIQVNLVLQQSQQ